MNFKSIPKCWRNSLLLVLLPVTAFAQMAVVFERAEIRIESPAIADTDKEVHIQHAPLTYSVESRQEDALRLEYIHTLNSLDAKNGVLIAFAGPTVAPLPPMKVYTPVDALFIADDGMVVQILPNITLGEMTQTLQARVPVKAFLFLKAGEAAKQGIHPRDVVSGSMFTPAPPMQQ